MPSAESSGSEAGLRLADDPGPSILNPPCDLRGDESGGGGGGGDDGGVGGGFVLFPFHRGSCDLNARFTSSTVTRGKRSRHRGRIRASALIVPGGVKGRKRPVTRDANE